MLTHFMGILFVVVVLTGLAFPLRADVRHYDIAVEVLEDRLRETVAIQLVPEAGSAELKLELASAMKVLSLTSAGQDVSFEHAGWELTLDLSGVTPVAGAEVCELVFEVEGRPLNRFSEKRGGFLRTTVGPDIAYIRSQYPWYPRLDGDAATYRTVVHARGDWLVRTAGRLGETEKRGERVRWTFHQESPIFRVGLVAGPYLKKELGSGSPIDAFVFAEDEAGAEHVMDVAQRAWQHYASRFGKIDRERYTIVEMPAPFGRQSGYGEEDYVLVGQGTIEQG